MILVNFSHPVTATQRAEIEKLTGIPVTTVLDQMPHLDHTQPFEEQVRAVVDRVPLDAGAWQTEPILVNLPGYAPAAGLLLAELHGRMGHFPAIVRLRPVDEEAVVRYEVAEILSLQHVRDRARQKRGAP